MQHKLGAHLSTAGGYHHALRKIVEIGGNCLQIFSASPRGWNFAKPSEETIQEFIQLKDELGIDPVYFHASYLINLADAASTGHMSKELLVNELQLAEKMHVRGSIIHTGSYKDAKERRSGLQLFPTADDEKYKTLLKNFAAILEKAPRNVLLMIENAGTCKIGQTIDEIAMIIQDLQDERIRVCLDTCHLHAAGYNLGTEENIEKFINDFDTKIGLNKLELWHVNDSRDTFGSLRDRHENIGEGNVGIETFRLLMNHPQTKHIPFIIETPGFDDKGPDKQNIDILKGLIGKL